MNILFIYSLQEIETSQRPLRSPELLQFGISYISAVLKESGHSTRLVVLSRSTEAKKNKRIIDKYIADFKPKLICFTAVSSEYGFISGIAGYIKKAHKDIYLFIGGVHVTLNPDGILNDAFDALCIGEGELPTLELVERLGNNTPPSGIANLWIKNSSQIEKNNPRPFLENLDTLPHLDREMWREWIIIGQQPLRQAVLLGRGCPFECTYCCNHALKKISPGKYVRLRSTEKIAEEIRKVANEFPDTREIYLEVETFYIDKDWALDLCAKLEELNRDLIKPLAFGVNLRVTPNTDYEALFKACSRGNFRFINIGLESGSERIRSLVLKRNYSNQDIINTVDSARRHKLQVAFFNMIGVPGETFEDFKQTLSMNRICLPDWVMTCIYFPYPGTDLYSLCKEKGLLGADIDTEMERSRVNLDLPGFSRKQIKHNYDWFYYHVYKGKRPTSGILLRVLASKLRAWSKLFQLYLWLRRNSVYASLKSSLQKSADF